jgi:hypothetical protein
MITSNLSTPGGRNSSLSGYHLPKNSGLKKSVNELLTKGFAINTIAEKLGWPEPLVWAVALEGKDDKTRFDKLQWNIRPWDWGDVDHRFGDNYPGPSPTVTGKSPFSSQTPHKTGSAAV